jgi:3-ketoacyl-CoA synthase
MVASEIATTAYYKGKDVKRLLANVIFRSGGAAALISNRPEAARTANYRLVTCTRAHGAASSPGAYT